MRAEAKAQGFELLGLGKLLNTLKLEHVNKFCSLVLQISKTLKMIVIISKFI